LKTVRPNHARAEVKFTKYVNNDTTSTMELSVKAWVLYRGCQLGSIVKDSGANVQLQFENGEV
jgi:hypothetical protein